MLRPRRQPPEANPVLHTFRRLRLVAARKGLEEMVRQAVAECGFGLRGEVLPCVCLVHAVFSAVRPARPRGLCLPRRARRPAA